MNDECQSQDTKMDPFPAWGGKWVSYEQHEDLQKELEDTKKKLTVAEARIASLNGNKYDVLAEVCKSGNLMANGVKACAEVAFTPKTY